MESIETAPGPLSEDSERVPLSVIVTYCLPTVGGGFMFLLVGLYLMKFATDVLLIAPAAMGTIFGLSRIWDAISDPVAGYLSDRTRHRTGRRRPWIFMSMFPIGLAYWMAWSPPAALSGGALTAWMAMGVFGFYAAMTIFVVPHLSLGAELTTDHHERSRIFGFRHIGWTIGSILALVGMAQLIQAEEISSEASREAASRLAIGVAIVTAAMIGFAAIRLRERPEFQGRGAEKPFSAFADVWGNLHARLLLTVTLIENLGAATIGVLTLYVAEYVIGAGHLAPVVILCYMVPSGALVPLWIPLSRRVGKKRLWMAAQLLTSASFGGMFFLGTGDVVMMGLLAVSAGVAAGAGGTLSPSLQADVIDFDEYHTGERKEGAYFSAWSFIYKSAYGITLMLTGYVLQLSGFEPNVEQTDGVKLALRTLYGAFPFVCYLGGALLLRNFALDEREHARIRQELAARGSNRPERE
ncbi:MAG: MFS transporter [Deltaproteobacteria bacterium]|nr:MFS transporter [Deltaproteobacteria bacterium]MBW2397159.1 MFS transporter [Deltaproteobacteria bacterium]